MKNRLFAVLAIVLLAGGFYLYQQTQWVGAGPAAADAGFNPRNAEQEARNDRLREHGLELEVENAQTEAEMLRHGAHIPGSFSQSDLAMGVAALKQRRAQLVMLAPEQIDAIAQADRDIRTLQQAEAELAARGYRR